MFPRRVFTREGEVGGSNSHESDVEGKDSDQIKLFFLHPFAKTRFLLPLSSPLVFNRRYFHGRVYIRMYLTINIHQIFPSRRLALALSSAEPASSCEYSRAKRECQV